MNGLQMLVQAKNPPWPILYNKLAVINQQNFLGCADLTPCTAPQTMIRMAAYEGTI
jgi:hypothetical protein